MKRIAKILLGALVAVIGVVLTGCNTEPEAKKFSLQFTGYGPGYVSANVTVPGATTVAYLVVSEQEDSVMSVINNAAINKATMINLMGTETIFYTDGEHQLLDFSVEANTHYYVYLVARLGENKLSELYTYEFETGDFVFDQYATILGVAPDGYKVRITVPPSVKNSVPGTPGSRAIRYTQGDLMIYNFYKSQNDDYFNLLYNAGRYVTEDTTIEFSDKLNYGEAGADVNEDGEIDGNDLSMLWNPIVPGEPVVFIAGEFEWMQEPWYGVDSLTRLEMVAQYQKEHNVKNPSDDNYALKGFYYPAGWEPGYYFPCIDSTMYWSFYGGAPSRAAGVTRAAGIINDLDVSSPVDASWTGAYQKKVFRTKLPEKLAGDFKVEIENLRSVDATICITPKGEIYRYLFTILDDGAYNEMLRLLNHRTEYLQWAITSYFAMYNFGQLQVVPEKGTIAPPAEINLTDFFYDVPSDTKYHVLITGMSGDIGSPQCFKHYTFRTPTKTKTEGPRILVKTLEDKTTPYTAAFNIKCTSVADNKAERCYYAANYKSDWVYDTNSGSNTYESLGQTTQFTDDELSQINSPEGLDIFIPSIDGETTRLVVVAFNDENISNGIDEYEDVLSHPAVEDCTTPYAEAANTGYNPLLHDGLLDGPWTLTATVVKDNEKFVKKAKVNIRSEFKEGVDYPSTLPADVKELYMNTVKGATDEEKEEIINDYFYEFKLQSTMFNEGRLRGQNKLLIEGWINDSQGSLDYLSPWDLFKHEKISMVDVPSMFARFGPKIYLHINRAKGSENYAKDADSLSITANKMFVSPLAQWSVPFYMAGIQESGDMVFSYTDTNTGAFGGALEFPVTLSEDLKTITIKPLLSNNAVWYPNVVGETTGIGGATSYILENRIVSEVVLTKGWTEPENGSEGDIDEEVTPTVRSSARKAVLKPVGNAELIKYSSRTDFKSFVKPVKIKSEVMTYEKVQANFAKFREQQSKRVK